MSITVNHLSKNYGSQVAVNKIFFSIQKGEVVGFLGPNGAGKTTTMKMITGYLPADEGEIEVCGIKTTTDTIESRKKIGYLPESNPLYTEMYVREYLAFIAGIHQIKNKRQAINDVISRVGLTIESHKKLGQLSKGYKQRVGLAAALVHDPEVLVLDEPTSGLDPNQIIEIRSVIKLLAATKTILFSSHIMQEVEALCDRVIIINKGNIVADDRLQNLQKDAGGNHYVVVEFKQPVDEALISSLSHVIEFFPIQSKYVDAASGWKIKTNEPDDIRKQLLRLSVDHNLDIVSLQSETQNLESVFQSLTL